MTFKPSSNRGRLRHRTPTSLIKVKPRPSLPRSIPQDICRVVPIQILKAPDFLDLDPPIAESFEGMLNAAVKELLLLTSNT